MSGSSSGFPHDVAILGGGPAGLACAFGLAQRGRSVVVLERSRYDVPRFGETLGPEIQPLLQQMGAWEAFAATPRIPFRAIYSNWGGPELHERASILHPLGEGWHVDRTEVDRVLACAAEAAGIPVRLGSGFCMLSPGSAGWEIAPTHGPAVSARYLVDASGRGAPATASAFPQRQWRKADRLLAASVRFPAACPAPAAGELLLEAAEMGWWYSVPQPDGALLVTLMTDADLLPSGGRPALQTAWHAALARTVYTRARAGQGASDPVRTVRADSGMLSPDRGAGWLAAGDAALACDPLSGSGFARALKAGGEAALLVHRALDGEDFATSTEARFEIYLTQKAQYYSLEQRWPNAPFWARRAPVPPEGSAVSLPGEQQP